MTSHDRRRFTRLEMHEDAIVTDDTGRLLGRVTQASGGGMQIVFSGLAEVPQLAIGETLRVTVAEPATNTRHSLNIVVRFVNHEYAGVEFVSGKAATAGRY